MQTDPMSLIETAASLSRSSMPTTNFDLFASANLVLPALCALAGWRLMKLRGGIAGIFVGMLASMLLLFVMDRVSPDDPRVRAGWERGWEQACGEARTAISSGHVRRIESETLGRLVMNCGGEAVVAAGDAPDSATRIVAVAYRDNSALKHSYVAVPR